MKFLALFAAALVLLTMGCTQPSPGPIVGNDSDAHGCKASAGYSWCEAKQKCLRPFEEACQGNGPNQGNCSASAGETWCESTQKCFMPANEKCPQILVGNDSDVHGCKISTGYAWCEQKQKCLREWEETCDGEARNMTDSDAIRMAIASPECSGVGKLTGLPAYNENTQTWWIDLMPDAPKAGCNPACVVSKNGTSEVNWRCTGAIPPQ